MTLPTLNSGARVRADDPIPTDWGLVVRGVGTWQIIEPYLQRRFDLTDPNTFYIGYAILGTLDASPAWTIKRIQFVAGNPTTLQWSDHTAIWNNRLVTVYS